MFRASALMLCVAALALSVAPRTSRGQEDPARTAALKAAFIYNFAKFTDWPGDRFHSPTDPVSICVGQNSPLRMPISVLADKLVGDRPVRVMVLTETAQPTACDVLFVDNGLPERIRQLTYGGLHGTLTVSDQPGFAQAGGQIGLFYAGNELRFQINLEAARRAGIGFSSKLLRLADVIGQHSSLPRSLAMARPPLTDWE